MYLVRKVILPALLSANLLFGCAESTNIDSAQKATITGWAVELVSPGEGEMFMIEAEHCPIGTSYQPGPGSHPDCNVREGSVTYEEYTALAPGDIEYSPYSGHEDHVAVEYHQLWAEPSQREQLPVASYRFYAELEQCHPEQSCQVGRIAVEYAFYESYPAGAVIVPGHSLMANQQTVLLTSC